MLAPARHVDAHDFAHDAVDFQDRYVPAELYSGDRICAAPDTCSGNGLLRAYLFIFAILAGGWMLIDAQSVQQMWASATAAIAPLVSYSAPAHDASAPAPALPAAGTNAAPTPGVDESSSPPLQPLNSREVTIAPSASDEAPQSQSPADSSTSDADGHTQAQEQEGEHLSPDQMRASKVGLNPDLSPVVLAQLSPTDYRNASFAIRTALAKTPDGEVFVWPRQRKPELALFRVRFVAGAAPDCRRYVVTITKHRWSTTALPVEKCGSAERTSASAQ